MSGTNGACPIERLGRKLATILVLAILLGAYFSYRSPQEKENNSILPPSYSVNLDKDTLFQCLYVKEIMANFEEDNITSLDVKIGLLPGSLPLDINELSIKLTYTDNEGEKHWVHYLFDPLKTDFKTEEMKVIEFHDPDNRWDSNIITQNSTVKMRFEGNFNRSTRGTLNFIGYLIYLNIDIIMPPFITSPPLYTKYNGMILLNNTGEINYSRPGNDDWLIEESINMKDREILLDNNIIVLKDSKLSFENVTLRIEATNKTKYGIYIGENAEFIVTNSTITSTNVSGLENLQYDINVFGNISLENSYLSHSQGLNIYGSSATIKNCSFYQNKLNFSYTCANITSNKFTSCNGINFMYGSCMIRDNAFVNLPRAIFGHGDIFYFQDNLMDYCRTTIFIAYRESTIIGNRFSNCENGISLDSGLIQVRDNEMIRVDGVGISLDNGVSVVKNNTLTDSGGITITGSNKQRDNNSYQAIIEDNLIQDSSEWGFLLALIDAYSGNNTIINSSRADICSQSATLVVFNNTLRSEVPLSIVSRNCTVSIINTSIDKCHVAVCMIESTAVIINSIILNDASGKFKVMGEMQEKCHLQIQDGSTVQMKDTVFDEDEVIFTDYKSRLILPDKTIKKEKPPLGWRFYANIALLVTTITLIGILIWIYKRGKRKKQSL